MSTIDQTPSRVNGHVDIVLESQRLRNVVFPVADPELDVLFTTFCRVPEFFAEARTRLQPYYFDSGAEVKYFMLWEALIQAAGHGDPTFDTVDLALRQVCRARLGMLPPGVEADATGLVRYCFLEAECNPASQAAAAAVMSKLLTERTVVQPLKRILAQGVNGSYAADIADIVNRVAEQSDRVGLASRPRTLKNWEQFSARAEAVARERSVLIEHLIAGRETTILSGDWGTGKTIVSCEISVCGAIGVPPFRYYGPGGTGGFQVPRPFRVGLYSAESGANILHRNINKILERVCSRDDVDATALMGNFVDNFYCDDEWIPDLSDPASLRRLCGDIRSRGLEYVIIDPLTMALGSIANKLKNGMEAYGPLREIMQKVQDAGAGMLWINQNASPKTDKQKNEAAPDPLRSSWPVLSQAARCSIAIKPGADYDHTTQKSTWLLSVRPKGQFQGTVVQIVLTEGANNELWEMETEPWAAVAEAAHTGQTVAAAAAVTAMYAAVLRVLNTDAAIAAGGVTAAQLIRRDSRERPNPFKVAKLYREVDTVLAEMQSRGSVTHDPATNKWRAVRANTAN